MLKLAVFGIVCTVLLVQGQEMPPLPPQPPNGPAQQMLLNRVTRQAMPMPQAMSGIAQAAGGMPGNLGMQGLGNIPDPTAIVAKAQEVGRQILGGRRRRQAPISVTV